jgi:hypothetical protein
MIIGHKGTGRAVGSILAVDSPKLSSQRPPDAGWASTASIGLRAFFALAGGAAITWLAIHRIPRALHAHTDLVGATTFTNFDIDYYFTAFNYAVYFFPATTVGLFLLATWGARRAGFSAGYGGLTGEPWDDIAESPSERRAWLVASVRVMATGAVLGLEAAIFADAEGIAFWGVELVVVALYALVVGMVSLALRGCSTRRGFPYLESARINAAGAVATIVGMLAASSVTSVRITQTGAEHSYPWLSPWLVLAIAILAGAVIFSALRSAPSVAGAQRVERRALTVVTAAVALVLVLSRIPGELGPMDMFHEGEGLVAARLNLLGYFPWRDVIWVHGLFDDTYRSQFGLQFLDSSRWGAVAGSMLVLYPLSAVSTYMLFVYLFRSNWPFLVLSLILPLGLLAGADISGSIFDGNRIRFILWPLVLLLLAAVLERPAPGRMLAFSGFLFVQLIVTPESAFALPACAAVVVAYEAINGSPGQRLSARFRRTIWCSATGLVLGAIFVIYLAAHHAVGDFLFYYRILSEGRLYQGSVPFSAWLQQSRHPTFDRVAAVAPLGAVVVSAWYAAARVLQRRAFHRADWIMAANAIFVLLYYQKFLARMDGHVYHVYVVALPLMLYIVYRLAAYAEGLLNRAAALAAALRATTRHPVSVALLMLSLLFVPSLPGAIAAVPTDYRATAATAPTNPRLGYATPGTADPALYSDVAQVMHAYLKAGDGVFDFSNQPAFYYYLLGYLPPTRYYHVLPAMAQDAQQDVIARLRAARPKLVVFDDDSQGQPHWDGIPNMVRHYEISQYILDNYKPLLDVHGQLIFVDADISVASPKSMGLSLSSPIVTDGLYFMAEQCDWGYSPNFFSVTPRPVQGRSAASVARQSSGTRVQLSLPAGARWTDYQWLEIDARRLAPDNLHISDSGSGGQRVISFSTLPDSPSRYLVRVGSCAQWHGYGNAPLTLSGNVSQDITQVRLLP